ncbi:ATP-binding protein [Roseococcus sp. SYP-B2431]|uniref:TrlF family AAA-like ATPase n=1 Tax=Roseococcus sp. SYP-B2431 TaxID=2496640 RepID=UPI001039E84A|nr:AAA family ATPase [Roseococcus sp. SYP-B2431]TCH96993.1 ATP-binding protein [Roseococcus sp. SYP-B2431]
MSEALQRGSLWHRWDPHIHTPGTILSDQYPANDGWEQFLARIEASDPPVRVLGITDYYSTATYEMARAYKAAGRMPNVELVFPNVELRLGIGTSNGNPVNVHLLVSPDDTDHVARLHGFLANLEFEALGERYRCTPEQIRALGRAHDRTVASAEQALEVGTNQFKIDLANLRDAFRHSAWAQENVLIGVAASSTDGTAGLQADASLARLRREIEGAAHVIFSGRPGDRSFWLGQNPAMSAQDVIAQYGGLKPCIHGSDAHRPGRVAAPDHDRRCWLKGDLRFETLRQACLEPDIRVFVGVAAPPAAPPSQTIDKMTVGGATFLSDPVVPLNPGLVGIIGARGSGKTALADFIAVGAEAFALNSNRLSFIDRAREHLGGTRVELDWGDETVSGAAIDDLGDFGEAAEPHVRYLSQQFVDRLCSAEGMTDELLEEIQRVIFMAHPTEERQGASNFTELLNLRADAARTARSHYEEELRELSNEFVVEQEKVAGAPGLRAQLAALQETIRKSHADRLALVAKSGGNQDRLDAYTTVANALQIRRSQFEQLERRKTALESLAAEVALYKTRWFPDQYRQLQQRHQTAQIPMDVWPRFMLKFEGDVDAAVLTEQRANLTALASLSGVPPQPPATPATSVLLAGAVLTEQTISVLASETKRLEGLIGVDKQASQALTQLNSKIAADEGRAANLARQIEAANKAPARVEEIRRDRINAYQKVFEALVAEQDQLRALYAPLTARIEAESGSARKLAFIVRRRVDVEQWGEWGEQFLDLRKGSTLRRGTLAELATRLLLPSWSGGNPETVTQALAQFREKYDAALTECCPYNLRDPADAAKVRQWAGQISAWLYGTSHIEIAYGVQYESTDVERLSPGTRGIVLLLLYLAIDLDDSRPLLIDQPEENLDPKSIFDELVARFRNAKQRRQIIIVTHNANLIVNADADQVIVATCGPHRPGELPEISYVSGGLEDPNIRARVCDILEGGEHAFKERAKRLRVRI